MGDRSAGAGGGLSRGQLLVVADEPPGWVYRTVPLGLSARTPDALVFAAPGRPSTPDDGGWVGDSTGDAFRCARTRSIRSSAWAEVNRPRSTARRMVATVLW